MRAVVYRGPGRVEVADVPEPVVEDPRDAIVRVSTTAICGSDLHFFHGKAPLEPGDTMGHEAVGVVERVGPGVTRSAPGQRVAVAFSIACGSCWFCEHGQTQLCEDARILGAGLFGGALGGAQAELVRVPNADVNLLRVGDGIDDDRAVFLGDVLPTAVHAAEVAAIRPGETVAVVGAGPVGFLAAQACLLHGPREVISIDLEPERLALAEAAGATPVERPRAQPADGGVRTNRRAGRRRGDRGGRLACGVRVRARRRAPRRPGRRRGGVRERGGAGPARRVVGAGARRAVHRAVSRARGVGARDERSSRRGGSIRSRSSRTGCSLEEAAKGYALFDERRATKVVLAP